MRKKRPNDLVGENQLFLEELYSRMKPLLGRLIQSLGASESEAEDILQEAFLRLWQKVELLRGLTERKCFNYVYTTVRNTAFTHLGRTGRQQGLPLEEAAQAASERGPEEYYLSLEKEGQFRSAMAALDERSRELLLMRYVLEEDDRHIAERFGVQPESVRMLMSRARAKLKAEMKRLEDSGEEERK